MVTIDDKPYKSKEWLEHQINVLGKTRAQVARECAVTPTTIYYWLLLKNNVILYNKKLETNTMWNNKNTDKVKNTKSIYYENNKDLISKKHKEYKLKNKYRIKHYNQKIYTENKEEMRNKGNTKNKYLREEAIKLLGGECAICGLNDTRFLTIDHVDGSGGVERRNGISGQKLNRLIVNKEYPKDKISNLRVLCYNHNCSITRKHFYLSYEEQNYSQRWTSKLWKEAFGFFGPCKTCGESELKFLSISHLHNDGAEKRKNGEKKAAKLLLRFRNLNWPESLKEDYCLECFNCNCSRGNRDE